MKDEGCVLKDLCIPGYEYGYGSLHRTCASSGYGCRSITELTQVSGRYTNVVPVPVPAHYFYEGIPVPRVLCHGRTELTEVPGRGINVLDNLQAPGMVLCVPYTTQDFHLHKLRVRVWKSYRTHRSSG